MSQPTVLAETLTLAAAALERAVRDRRAESAVLAALDELVEHCRRVRHR